VATIYQEVVSRKIAVPNPFARAENLCLTWWQDTREAVRAGFNNDSLQKEQTLNKKILWV